MERRNFDLSDTKMDLSIIITTFNTKSLLRKAIKTILEDAELPSCQHEIIVVDNHSSDKTAETIKEEFPAIQLIVNDRNFGASVARNQGIKASKGQYILLLDSDTFIRASAIITMLSFIKQRPDCGAVGCKLLYADGRLQPSARKFPTVSSEIFHSLFLNKLIRGPVCERYTLLNWHHQSEREVDWIVLACLLVRRNAIFEIGLLDENFFYGFEDTDLCYCLWQHGWKVIFTPDATAIHIGRQSIKGIMPEISRQIYRAKLYFFEKHYNRKFLPIIKLTTGLGIITNLFAWQFSFVFQKNNRERAKSMMAEQFYLLKNILLGRV